MIPACNHCKEPITDDHYQDEHPGFCCDCFDLSVGMPLEQINKERSRDGKAPITKPWTRP